MINFPDSPAVNQTFTAAGVTWVWDGIKWNMSSIAGSPFIFISTSPPANPTVGALWWDSIGGQLYIWFNDGSSTQWVSATNQGFGGTYLPLVGGNLSGPLRLAADPVIPLGAATKEYVDLVPTNYSLGSNRLINGDFLVTQYGPNGTLNGFTADRWRLGMNQAGKLNWQVAGSAAMVPNGFPRCMSIVSLSAYTALATDSFCFYQTIEANFVSDFAWGTTGARPVTLSFWVNVSIAGTYSGCISNYGPPATRSYPFTFNAPVGWSKQIITIPGDAGGTWVNSGIGGSIYVTFDLGSGTNYRGIANQWQNAGLNGANGTVNIVANNGAVYQLVGIKLEIGSIATPYNIESLSKRMSDCQRYFTLLTGLIVAGYNGAGQAVYGGYAFPSLMRAAATITFLNPIYSNSSNIIVAGQSVYGFYPGITITATGMGYAQYGVTVNAEL